MASNFCFCLCFFVMFMFLCQTQTFEASNSAGFSVQLIGRNSSHDFPFRKLHKHRSHSFNQLNQLTYDYYSYEYLMRFTLGTPPVEIYGVYDTGSGISSKAFPSNSCSPQNVCVYNYAYYDTVTLRVIANEIATFNFNDIELIVRDFLFGCGHYNNLKFSDGNFMGIIGFDQVPLSLISQIGTRFGGRRFFQCLVSFHVDHNIAGKINFVTTPLVSRETPHYYVTVKGISVGNKFLPFNPSQQFSEGHMMIDSESIGHDPRFEGLLCFRSGKIPEGPILTFHFEGASVQLMSTQTFFMIEEGLFCFGMDGVSAEPYAFGNFVQSNILIGFDLDRKTISFMPTDRTKRVGIISM
ncbi:Aspartic proteinase CDR1 [Glycine soja]|uniref:Peptidase A1 domain-containing protein n=2 Tax=Glycine subgen. Soja TaxID=1462606 RepID=K7KD67_SOYBN|nr:Aspartic proteinase CDR1 [Glycine soja]